MEFPGAGDTSAPKSAANSGSLDEVKRIRCELSLKLLRGLDLYVEEILHQTPFVTAYVLSDNKQWERSGVEGFLYLLKRSNEPRHSLIVVNRKSERHLMEFITPEFQITRENNYIFYRALSMQTRTMQNTRSLWFYDEKECVKTFEKILAVAVNREPVPGFSKNAKPDTVPPTAAVTANSPPVAASTLNAHAEPTVYPTPDTDKMRAMGGFNNAGTLYQQRANVSGAPSGPAASAPMPPAPMASTGSNLPPVAATEPTSKDPQRFVNMLKPLIRGGNQSPAGYTPRTSVMPPVHFPSPAFAPQFQPREQQPMALPTGSMPITVTYEMLCAACAETMQSEDFLKLLWRRLTEKAARYNG
ncbi:Dcp1-like decapping family protein, putative [Babesia bigemina]|uniref:Dcp1-like decapping family protein, putative n=1 Tax=Babesia bigemina TaxID=5866 RepID=A0A061DEH5_BABBI|nr:Dcp1-like decapping family protein, putative [Babesia bigemina]CDR97290.1 Dcp1-like decapping family protein, putative [Babesia bigemina]|eukprot:XP_012769476.1 Dcp1-like decapping family protein, putative [Babesia bigemina]